MQDNLEAVISVLQFIYDNIMYAELNTKSDTASAAATTARSRSLRMTASWCGVPQVRQP